MLSSVLMVAAIVLAALPAFSALAAAPVYVVQPGDTLSGIAASEGTTLAELLRLNSVRNPNIIYVGQRLRLPEVAPAATETPTADAEGSDCSPVLHVVAGGETLSGIAVRYGVTVAELAASNRIANPSLIRVGQALAIPGGFCQQPLELNPPFSKITWSPELPKQGDTVLIEVETEKAVESLTGYFGQVRFRFIGDGRRFLAYVGVPALAEPGYRQLQLMLGGEAAQVLAVPIAEAGFEVERLLLTPETTALLAPDIVQHENNVLASVTAGFTPELLWRGAFRHPLDGNPPVISAFGTRRAYNDGPVSSFHGGVDFPGEAGTPVHASAAGRVVLAEELKVRGNVVILDHGAGIFTMYCHLESIVAKVGDVVQAGDVVGLMGSTGLSTGPHLHWEMRVQGERVDALRWLGRER